MAKIDFLGKGEIAGHHLTVPYYTLNADIDKSIGTGSLDDNLIIHGDNLLALKSLIPRYAGRVKCIYIDPPYNTGNEGWVYNDKVNSPLMNSWLDSAVDREDQTRHDKWLCLMCPRLQLLRELLSDDGVIFVSIDDNEQHRLRLIMEDIFGEVNFLNTICYVNNIKGRQISGSGAAGTFEYILAFAKDKRQIDIWEIDTQVVRKSMPCVYRMDDYEILSDHIGDFVIKNQLYNTNSEFNEETRHNLVFNIHYNPNNEEVKFSSIESNITFPGFTRITPHKNNNGEHEFHAWRWSQEKIISEKHDLYFKKKGSNFQIYTKIRDFTKTNFKNLFMDLPSGARIQKIIGVNFPNPKPVEMIRYLIQITTSKNDIILDSFAGSGTTAHAVLDLNKEDGGNRKFILVECEDYADSITAERVRRVIAGVAGAKSESLRQGLGGSFSFVELGEVIDPSAILTGSSMPEWSALARHVFWLATGETLHIHPVENEQYFVGSHKGNAVYLRYKPSVDFMQSNAAVLSANIAQELRQKHAGGGRILYYAAYCYMNQKTMDENGIVFCQLPWAITKHTLPE